MATLEERLTEAGVDTLEALELKIKTDAETASQTKIDSLDEQVKNLELIKGTQGTEIGELRKERDTQSEALRILKESKQAENELTGSRRPEKTEDDWKAKNSDREKAFKNEDWDKVDDALKNAATEVKALVKTEEGRSAFYDQILGTSTEQAQETLRRPVQKEKLTVAEQMDAYLAKEGSTRRIPSMKPSGTGPSGETKLNKTAGQTIVNASWDERMAGILT